MLYIGIDLGTSAVKLLLMNEAGEILHVVSRDYPLEFPRPGWSQQNPADWQKAVWEGIPLLLEGFDGSQVAGIGAGGQMHGLVVLDEEDRVIRPAILWNDGRTAKQVTDLNETVGSGYGKGGENRVTVVSEISRALKIMAKELNVPVICLSQLSRANESRQDKRPILSDLRESGAIEQDADEVLFLYRDDYYNENSEEKNVAECIVSKNRHGETGTVKLQWLPQYTTFTDREWKHAE